MQFQRTGEWIVVRLAVDQVALGHTESCDQEIGAPVAVDIARARNGVAGLVAVSSAVKGGAGHRATHVCQVDSARKLAATALAVDQVALAPVAAGPIPAPCPDQEIGQSVAVDITRTGDGTAGLIVVGDPLEGGPRQRVSQIKQIERAGERVAAPLAVDQVALAPVGATGIRAV